MKKITIALCVLFATVTATKAQISKTTTPGVIEEKKDISKVLQFTNDSYDFGKIVFGKPTEYQVTVKNISKDSVTLQNVQAGCGCTTPKGYEKGEKIAPGKSKVVTLGFNGGTKGIFTKFVTFFFDGGMQKQVTFRGETFTPADQPAPANEAAQKLKTPSN